jgi:hypothetical protein
MKQLLLVLAAMLSTDVSADVWRWSGNLDEATVLDVEIVRGRVSIERTARTGVEIAAQVSDPSISMRIAYTDGRLQIRDFYRVRPAWFPMHECLPPPGEHGDFAAAHAEVELVVRVPMRAVVNVRVMADE